MITGAKVALAALLLASVGLAGCGKSSDEAKTCVLNRTPPPGYITDLSTWETTRQTEMRERGSTGNRLATIASGQPLLNLLDDDRDGDGWVEVACWQTERPLEGEGMTIVGFVEKSALREEQ
jgi:hypothetical protein